MAVDGDVVAAGQLVGGGLLNREVGVVDLGQGVGGVVAQSEESKKTMGGLGLRN